MDKPLTTEQVLKDLRDAYLMPREVPEGWVTARMAAKAMTIGSRAAANRLNQLVSQGKWESQMALIESHATRIYRPIAKSDSTVMVEK